MVGVKSLVNWRCNGQSSTEQSEYGRGTHLGRLDQDVVDISFNWRFCLLSSRKSSISYSCDWNRPVIQTRRSRP